MKIKLEYIWLDGYKPEPNLRSKVKVIDFPEESYFSIDDCPEWAFDGSSTKQAEGNFSDCILNPVRVYESPFKSGYPTFFILCEVMNPDGSPHESNRRSLIGEEEEDIWFGFEQEYTLTKNNRPLGFPKKGFPEGQGKYYCGVGYDNVHGRDFVNSHLDICLAAGLDLTGTNAEVMPGQWEYQVFGKGKLKAADDLWMSRYLLELVSEEFKIDIELHPKPVDGDWNGSGLHCNFSNTEMRDRGNKAYYERLFEVLKDRHKEHIAVYGSDNDRRLTGKHETQSIDKFSVGASDRGASIRIPLATTKDWKGYLEDRRPASNADPYEITKVVSDSLYLAKGEYEAVATKTN